MKLSKVEVFLDKTKTADGATEKITVVENNGYTLKMLSNIWTTSSRCTIDF